MAFRILDDPDREFVSSNFVRLELLPKAVYNRNQSEIQFLETFFKAVTEWAPARRIGPKCFGRGHEVWHCSTGCSPFGRSSVSRCG